MKDEQFEAARARLLRLAEESGDAIEAKHGAAIRQGYTHAAALVHQLRHCGALMKIVLEHPGEPQGNAALESAYSELVSECIRYMSASFPPKISQEIVERATTVGTDLADQQLSALIAMARRKAKAGHE